MERAGKPVASIRLECASLTAVLACGCLAASPAHAQTADWMAATDHTAQLLAHPHTDTTTTVTSDGNERWIVRTSAPLDSPLAVMRPDTRHQTTRLEWQQDWEAFNETTPSGLEVSLTPHAGLGFGREGTTATAGATLKLGRGLADMAPDGDEEFGDKARWYLFASGSRRAVGYNLTRGTDGSLHREGISQDVGHTLGDAAIGLAWRRGAIQSTVGLAYREVEIDGLRGYGGRRTDVDEGVLTFQLSIRPQ